jgi:hypothetical protein
VHLLEGSCDFACPWSVLSPLCLFLRDHAFLSRLCWAVAHVFGDRDIALAFVVSLMPSDLVLCSCVVFFTWMSCSSFALSNHFFVLTCCQSAPQGGEIWKIKLIWILIWWWWADDKCFSKSFMALCVEHFCLMAFRDCMLVVCLFVCA